MSPALRKRLKIVTDRYIALGEIGIGQEGLWVWGEEVEHRLAMHFGFKTRLGEVFLSGEWHAVLDAVEIYLAVAQATAYQRAVEIHSEFNAAFGLSGSVYYVNGQGQVALRMEPDAAAKVERAAKVLTPSAKAREVFDRAVGGLLSRRMLPQDVVKDVFVAFEEYMKGVTGQKDFADAVKALRQRGILASTQAQLMDRLYGFRSEVFGATHAGEARTPTEADALWYVETVSAQLAFLGNVVK